MSDSRRSLDRAEHLTVSLFVLFSASLVVVYALDEPIGWLVWGATTVVVVGAVMVLLNRSTPVEDR